MPTLKKTSVEAYVSWKMPAAGRKRYRIEALRPFLVHGLSIAITACVGVGVSLFFSPTRAVLAKTLSHLTPSPAVIITFLLLAPFVLALFMISGRGYYKIGNDGLSFCDLIGWRKYEWSRIESYCIDEWPGLKLLRFHRWRAWSNNEWPFDPAEVDEDEIRRLFEEHGVPDADSGPWFGVRKR